MSLDWNQMYALAVAYYNHYGNSEIRQNYRTINGYEEDACGYGLGRWIANTRVYYKKGKLTDEQIEKLRKINFRFDRNYYDIEWEKMYALAVAYYNHYGTSLISRKFKTINGYEYDEHGVKLGVWLCTNRLLCSRGKLSEEKKKKLNEINFRLEVRDYDDIWEKMYTLAETYYNKYGNLNVPKEFRTINGYEFDEHGYSLGIWIIGNRNLYLQNKLSEYRKEKLARLDFRFEVDYYDKEWERIYNLCAKYYSYNGSLDMRYDFRTKNGYEYDKEGYRLGMWLTRQKQLFKNGKLDKERYNKLKRIEFDLLLEDKITLCKRFKIDYIKYSYIIDITSYKELFSKIYYLLDNRYEVVDGNGNINRIFFISSDTLKLNYGFTTDELIEYYFHNYMKELIDDYYNKRKVLVK